MKNIIYPLMALFILSCDSDSNPISPDCDEGYEMEDGECALICDEGLLEVNGECVLMCPEGFSDIDG